MGGSDCIGVLGDDLVGVKTLVCDVIITLGSVINETNHLAAGCTLESLGLGNVSVERLRRYAATGRLQQPDLRGR